MYNISNILLDKREKMHHSETGGKKLAKIEKSLPLPLSTILFERHRLGVRQSANQAI